MGRVKEAIPLFREELEGCREVSGWAVSGAARTLQTLSLGGCTLATDAGIGALTMTDTWQSYSKARGDATPLNSGRSSWGLAR